MSDARAASAAAEEARRARLGNVHLRLAGAVDQPGASAIVEARRSVTRSVRSSRAGQPLSPAATANAPAGPALAVRTPCGGFFSKVSPVGTASLRPGDGTTPVATSKVLLLDKLATPAAPRTPSPPPLLSPTIAAPVAITDEPLTKVTADDASDDAPDAPTVVVLSDASTEDASPVRRLPVERPRAAPPPTICQQLALINSRINDQHALKAVVLAEKRQAKAKAQASGSTDGAESVPKRGRGAAKSDPDGAPRAKAARKSLSLADSGTGEQSNPNAGGGVPDLPPLPVRRPRGRPKGSKNAPRPQPGATHKQPPVASLTMALPVTAIAATAANLAAHDAVDGMPAVEMAMEDLDETGLSEIFAWDELEVNDDPLALLYLEPGSIDPPAALATAFPSGSKAAGGRERVVAHAKPPVMRQNTHEMEFSAVSQLRELSVLCGEDPVDILGESLGA